MSGEKSKIKKIKIFLLDTHKVFMKSLYLHVCFGYLKRKTDRTKVSFPFFFFSLKHESRLRFSFKQAELVFVEKELDKRT